jgi:hypothetical protein
MESRRGNFLQDKAEEGGILAVFRPTTTQDCRKLTAGFPVFILWLGSYAPQALNPPVSARRLRK